MKRWPIIRHVRYFIIAYHFNRWWFEFGRHHWLVPNESDLKYLDDVWNDHA